MNEAQNEKENLGPYHILHTKKALKLKESFTGVCCYHFTGDLIFAGYDDGLVCIFGISEPRLLMVFVGHVNRINSIILGPDSTFYTFSNDCTVRQWSMEGGECV